MKSVFKNNILILIIFFCMLLIGSNYYIFNKYRFFSVMSESMEPNINMGAIILSGRTNNFNVGDVISFIDKESGKTITHRLIGIAYKDHTYYITKGDANNINDFQLITREQIIGKVLLKIPYLGYITNYLKTIPGLIILIIIPLSILLYKEIINLKMEILQWRKKIIKSSSSR